MNKRKQRIWILILCWYIIGSVWLGRFIYLNFIPKEYEMAYVISCFVYGMTIYGVVAHYYIMGTGKKEN